VSEVDKGAALFGPCFGKEDMWFSRMMAKAEKQKKKVMTYNLLKKNTTLVVQNYKKKINPKIQPKVY
jgi:hypothetical protein